MLRRHEVRNDMRTPGATLLGLSESGQSANLAYQSPRRVRGIQVDDSTEVVVKCNVDVQTADNTIWVSKYLIVTPTTYSRPVWKRSLSYFFQAFSACSPSSLSDGFVKRPPSLIIASCSTT